MSENYQSASAFAGWPAPGLARPRGLGATFAGLGPVAMTLLKSRQWLDALKRRRGPAGGGGPQEPPEHNLEADSIWDDPMLWTLIMMH